MNLDEYIKFWGQENLLRYDVSIVNNLRISAESKQFLIQVGLPIGGEYTIPLHPIDPTLPELQSVCFDRKRIPMPYRFLRLLGSKKDPSGLFKTLYGIHEEMNGSVFAVYDRVHMEPTVRFVNSSVQQYGEFIFQVEKWISWLYGENYRSEDKYPAAWQLIRILQEIDQEACELEVSPGLEAEWGDMIAYIKTTGAI